MSVAECASGTLIYWEAVDLSASSNLHDNPLVSIALDTAYGDSTAAGSHRPVVCTTDLHIDWKLWGQCPRENLPR